MNLSISKIIIIVFSIIQSTLVSGQARNSNPTNQIIFTPLRIADLVNPGLELGYEKFYANRLSSVLSVAYMKDFFNTTPFEKYKGWRFSFEEKFYLTPGEPTDRYLSGEFVYMKVKYDYISSYKKDTALTTPEYADSLNVAKRVMSLNIKYGRQILISNRLTLDINIGIGLRHKVVNRSGVNDINAFEVKARHPNAYEMANKEGNYFGVSLPVNIRIGYRF